MAEEQFKVELTGDLSKLNRELKKGQKEISFFENQIEGTEAELKKLSGESARTSIAIQKLNKAFEAGKISADRYNRSLFLFRQRQDQVNDASDLASKNLRRYRTSLTNLGGGYVAAGKSVNKALPVVQEFGRVIQDAPFGIIGVGNNITQLGDAFGVLSRKAGGGRAALALFGRALLGPAGILVAVSSIVSILTVFARRTQQSTSELKEFKKGLDGVVETQKIRLAFTEAQERIAEAQGKSIVGALKNQKIALELNLQELRTEAQRLSLLIEKNKKERESVTNWERLVALGDFFLTNVINEIDRRLGFIVEGFNFLATTALGIAQVNFNGLTDPFVKGLEETNEEKQKGVDLDAQDTILQTKILGILADILEVEKKINDEREKRVDPTPPVSGVSQPIIASGTPGSVSGQEPDERLAEVTAQFTKGLAPLSSYQQAFGEFLLSVENSSYIFDGFFENLGKLDKGQIAFAKFAIGVDQLINTSLVPALQTLGDTLGRELQRGASFLEGFGKGALAAFSGFLSKLADHIIEFGVATVAIGKMKTVLEIPSPGAVTIATGIAAIAAGTLLKSFASFGSSSAGGQTSSSLSGSSGFTANRQFSGSMSGSASGGFGGGGEVVFRIAGTSLIGVIDRTLKGKNKTTADIIR